MKKGGKYGFNIARVLVVSVIIVVIGVAAYCLHAKLYPARRSTSSSVARSADMRLSPYKGWKTYTLKYEKLSFMYPPSWSIQDMTDVSNGPNGPETGLDLVGVFGPNDIQISIRAGDPSGVLFAGGVPVILGADKISFLGNDAYLVYAGNPGGTIMNAFLNNSPTDTVVNIASRHIVAKAAADGYTQGKLVIGILYSSNVEADIGHHQTIAEARQDPNYITAKAIISSMRY